MRLNCWLASAATSLLLCAPPQVQAAGTLDKIKASKTLSLGYRQTSVPFSYAGGDRQPWGYSVERWFGVLGKPGEILESLYFLNGLPE